MADATLLTSTGNIHNKIPGLKEMLALGAAVSVLSEAKSRPVAKAISAKKSLRFYPTPAQMQGLAGKEPIRGIARVVASNRLKILGSGMLYYCDAWEPALRIAPVRRGAFLDFEHPLAAQNKMRGFRLVGAHPTPGPEALRGQKGRDHALVKRYEDFWSVAAAHLHAGRKNGLIPLLFGDLQLPDDVNTPWAPATQFKKLDMGFESVHIDYIGFGNEVKAVNEPKVIQLFDHKGFSLRLG